MRMGVPVKSNERRSTFSRYRRYEKCMSVSSLTKSTNVGGQTDGSPWRIGVQDPQDLSAYLAVVEVTDGAVVTSGGYQRYFEEDGQVYWHIMDPATGAPADSGLLSATIVGPSGARCDGLSTAAFVLGVEGTADLWRAAGDFEFLLVDEDGTIWISAGLEDRSALAAGYEDRRVEVVRP